MTIAIGFIQKRKKTLSSDSQPAIWMASDSQATYDSAKRENPNKISVISFRNGQILVAQAHSVELGDKTIEKLQKRAVGVVMKDDEEAIKTVISILREVRNELVELNKPCDITDWDKFFWTEHRLDLLVGYIFNGVPYLWKTDIYRCVYTRVRSFEAIGGGKDLGYFLLKEYAQAFPDFDFGFPIAISVAEKVASSVDGCGLPVWVGRVYLAPPNVIAQYDDSKDSKFHCFAALSSQGQTGAISQAIKTSEARIAVFRAKEIERVMKRLSLKFLTLWIKERTSHNRFIQMRYGEPVLLALQSVEGHIKKKRNKNARTLFKEFCKELEGVNNKPRLKAIWDGLCAALPSVSGLNKENAEIAKLF